MKRLTICWMSVKSLLSLLPRPRDLLGCSFGEDEPMGIHQTCHEQLRLIHGQTDALPRPLMLFIVAVALVLFRSPDMAMAAGLYLIDASCVATASATISQGINVYGDHAELRPRPSDPAGPGLSIGGTGFDSAWAEVSPWTGSNATAKVDITATGVITQTPFTAPADPSFGGVAFAGSIGGTATAINGGQWFSAQGVGGITAAATYGRFTEDPQETVYLGIASISSRASMQVSFTGYAPVQITGAQVLSFSTNSAPTLGVHMSGSGGFHTSYGTDYSTPISAKGALIMAVRNETVPFGAQAELSSDDFTFPGETVDLALNYFSLDGYNSSDPAVPSLVHLFPPIHQLLFPVVEDYGTTNPVYAVYSNESHVSDAIAVGYRFESGNESPAFAGFVIPEETGMGDNQFILKFDAHELAVGGGDQVNFTDFYTTGVRSFSLTGIDLSEGRPGDRPPTFPHGFRFVEEGLAEILVTPIAVPEPSSCVLLASAFVAILVWSSWKSPRQRIRYAP